MKQLLFILISLTLLTKTVCSQEAESKPFIIGEIIEIRSLQLSEKRILNIYLPDGYQQNDTVKYPVIYLLDGAADEDFIHIVGMVQFFNFPWINTVPKSIVAGIANVDRRRDFTYPTTFKKDKTNYPSSGGSEKFIAFIEKEVQPFVENKYRTNSSKTIIGQSLGGLLAPEIRFKKQSLLILISLSVRVYGGMTGYC